MLEAIFDAPKPKQVVVGDGTESCLKVDAIRCRSNALLKNIFPLPVASVVDEIQEYDPSISDNEFELSIEADFYFIDAGEPLDNVLDALPYMGPNWYWRQNADAIVAIGFAKLGKIEQSHVLYTFTASEHAPANALVEPYSKIEDIVRQTMTGRTNPNPWPPFSGPKPYTEKEIETQVKNIQLAGQGSWTSQKSNSWKCVHSLYEESCPGPVRMHRKDEDGTTRFMSRTELLKNRTMFLIGRIALGMEHLMIWWLHFSNQKDEPSRAICNGARVY